MRRPWRFILGAAIGIGAGYAAVLLLRPALRRRRPRLRVLYRSREQSREQQRVA